MWSTLTNHLRSEPFPTHNAPRPLHIVRAPHVTLDTGVLEHGPRGVAFPLPQFTSVVCGVLYDWRGAAANLTWK